MTRVLGTSCSTGRSAGDARASVTRTYAQPCIGYSSVAQLESYTYS